jgi:nucleotide-binding universal stress UspA family protein
MAADFKKIVIAVDGEPVALHSAEVGIQLSCCLSTEIAFIHAVDPALTYAPGIAPAELVAEAERDGKRVMDKIAAEFPLLPAKEFIRVGKPTHEILHVAKEWAADVIVMGTHGRGGTTRVLLGSVAEEVMRHADCPVLVVRGKAE